MNFDNTLISYDNFLVSYRSEKTFLELKIIHNNLLNSLEKKNNIFKSLNIYSEKIILKDIYYVKKTLNKNDIKFNIKQFKNYIDYLNEVIYILLVNKNKKSKDISRVDKMVNYLIFG